MQCGYQQQQIFHDVTRKKYLQLHDQDVFELMNKLLHDNLGSLNKRVSIYQQCFHVNLVMLF